MPKANEFRTKTAALDHPAVQSAIPWLAGAGMALGHAAVASNCTVPTQGHCTTCGSCIVVVGSLALWAIRKNRGPSEFFEDRR